ncbi:MAG TPA: hypothetical protein VI320_37160 [Terracidiphilus sp.]
MKNPQVVRISSIGSGATFTQQDSHQSLVAQGQSLEPLRMHTTLVQ